MALGIKRTLEQIIEYAYPGLSKKEIFQYKKFKLDLDEKIVKSFGGQYFAKEARIRIMDILHVPANILSIIAIHELAHHIQYVDTKKTNHQKEFYEIYKKLVYTALNMNVIEQKDLTQYQKHTAFTDRNKVATMLKGYHPKKVFYKTNMHRIHVYGAYEKKEELKERGYKWHSLDKSWAIELYSKEDELEWLYKNFKKYNIEVVPAAKIHKKNSYFLTIKGSTYNLSFRLEKSGYEKAKNKTETVWKKEIYYSNLTSEYERLRDIIESCELEVELKENKQKY